MLDGPSAAGLNNLRVVLVLTEVWWCKCDSRLLVESELVAQLANLTHLYANMSGIGMDQRHEQRHVYRLDAEAVTCQKGNTQALQQAWAASFP